MLQFYDVQDVRAGEVISIKQYIEARNVNFWTEYLLGISLESHTWV